VTAYMLSLQYAVTRPSVTRVDESKTVEAMIMLFYSTAVPSIPLVFVG